MRFLAELLLLFVIIACLPVAIKGYSRCDQGWLKFGDNCYFFNHDKAGKANWNEAKRACEILGAHLVDIQDECEWNFVKSFLQPGDAKYAQYIIGMSDVANEGSWKFTDGKPVSFLKWGPYEPSGKRKENCGGIFTNTFFSLFNDTTCTAKHGRFICKKKAAQ